MKIALIAAVAAALLALAAVGLPAAEENRGADRMTLEGGSRGPVPFPHHRHQTALDDCQACHAVFPQEAGSIERLKAEGTLKAQSDVMNKLCVKCHRAKRRDDVKTGPITCRECHRKG